MESRCKTSKRSDADGVSVHNGDSSQHDDKASTSNVSPQQPCRGYCPLRMYYAESNYRF